MVHVEWYLSSQFQPGFHDFIVHCPNALPNPEFARVEGIEPPLAVLETAVLPLNDTPKFINPLFPYLYPLLHQSKAF